RHVRFTPSRVRSRRLIRGEQLDAILAPNFDRDDLVREPACLLGGAETLLRTFGEAVLRRAGELRLGDKIFRVPARMLARERIVEAVTKNAVMDFRGTHAVAPAAPRPSGTARGPYFPCRPRWRLRSHRSRSAGQP